MAQREYETMYRKTDDLQNRTLDVIGLLLRRDRFKRLQFEVRVLLFSVQFSAASSVSTFCRHLS